MNENMVIARSSNQDLYKIGNHGGAITSILRFALDKGMFDGVVVVKANRGDRYDGIPVLKTESHDLLEAAGALHCSIPNIPRFIKEYLDGAFSMKLAVVGKPCDIRAIIELQKRRQISIENLTLIGLNCTGTMSPVKAKEMFIEVFEVDPGEVIKEDIDDGKLTIFLRDGTTVSRNLAELEANGYGRRENCRRCETNIPRMADLACGKWGTEDLEKKGSLIEVCSQKGKILLEETINAGYLDVEAPTEEGIRRRERKDAAEITRAKEWQQRYFNPIRELNQSERFMLWMNEFEKCVKCYGCRDACPICHCENCILEANRGLVEYGEVPPNIMFHLTRLSHVADSCIDCGQCQGACRQL